MTPPKYRRSIRNILVLPKMQLGLSFYICATTVSMAAVIIYYQVTALNKLVEQLSDVVELETLNNVAAAVDTINLVTIMCGLVLISINFLICTYLFHRLAGASFAIKTMINNIKNGDYTKRRLRPKDELQEIMTALHELADALEKKR